MGIAGKAGNLAFKAFTAGLGVATVYLTANFSINLYRGVAWHNAQSPHNELQRSASYNRAWAALMLYALLCKLLISYPNPFMILQFPLKIDKQGSTQQAS